MVDELGALVASGGVLVLTGAGVSTDSGIPDYRGTPGVVRRPPITYRKFVEDPAARRRYWARSHIGWRRITEAAPNAGHRAIAALEKAGLVTGVITQNVDGLHQAAGTIDALELHGSLGATVCLDCGDQRSRLELHHRLNAANPVFTDEALDFGPDGDAVLANASVAEFRVVACLECGGMLKPAVVFFGENVAKPVVEAAFGRLDAAQRLLVVGSSLTVMSGFRFVLAARRQRKPVAIVNRGPTRGDEIADLRVDGEIAETLVPLVGDLVGAARR